RQLAPPARRTPHERSSDLLVEHSGCKETAPVASITVVPAQEWGCGVKRLSTIQPARPVPSPGTPALPATKPTAVVHTAGVRLNVNNPIWWPCRVLQGPGQGGQIEPRAGADLLRPQGVQVEQRLANGPPFDSRCSLASNSQPRSPPLDASISSAF